MGILINHKPSDVVLIPFIVPGRVSLALIITGISAQLCFYSGSHFKGIEGLCNIIVRPDGKSHDFIHILPLCRKHNDRIKILFPDFPANAKAVDIGKHHVQNYQIQIRGFNACKRISSIIKFVDGIAVVSQIYLNQIGNFSFVIHYQNPLVHFFPLFRAVSYALSSLNVNRKGNSVSKLVHNISEFFLRNFL